MPKQLPDHRDAGYSAQDELEQHAAGTGIEIGHGGRLSKEDAQHHEEAIPTRSRHLFLRRKPNYVTSYASDDTTLPENGRYGARRGLPQSRRREVDLNTRLSSLSSIKKTCRSFVPCRRYSSGKMVAKTHAPLSI